MAKVWTSRLQPTPTAKNASASVNEPFKQIRHQPRLRNPLIHSRARGHRLVASLDEPHQALFRFLDKVNRESATLTDRDLDGVRAAGWTDEALYFAITVCALFNCYNRWIDATGVHALSDEAHRQGGRRSAQSSYVRT